MSLLHKISHVPLIVPDCSVERNVIFKHVLPLFPVVVVVA